MSDGAPSDVPISSDKPRPLARSRRWLAFIFAILGLLILGCGSLLIGWGELGMGIPAHQSEPYPGARAEAEGAFLLFVWLPTLIAASLAGTIALLLVQRYQDLVPFLFCCFLVALGSNAALGSLLCPCTGGVAAVIIALFIALNIGAMYVAWRFVRLLHAHSP